MAEIKFSCPHCNQRIGCDEAYGGAQIQCPACGREITVPAGAATQAAPRLSISRGPPPAQPAAPPSSVAPAAMQPAGTSKLALSSLILSALTLLIGPFGFIPGIICGHLAKSELKLKPG